MNKPLPDDQLLRNFIVLSEYVLNLAELQASLEKQILAQKDVVRTSFDLCLKYADASPADRLRSKPELEALKQLENSQIARSKTLDLIAISQTQREHIEASLAAMKKLLGGA